MILIFYDFLILVKIDFTFVCMRVRVCMCVRLCICMYVCFYDVHTLYVLPTWRNKR